MRNQKEIGKLKLIPISQNPLQYIGIPAKILTIIDNTKWNLSDGRYEHHNFRQLVPYIYQLSCLCIDFNRNGCKQILMEIQEIRFGDLRELSLTSNNIDSIEILGRIYLPHLENLVLNQNKIVCLRPFARIGANCQNLQWISLQHNPISQDQLQKFPTYFIKVQQTLKYLEISNENKQQTHQLKKSVFFSTNNLKTSKKLNFIRQTMKWTAKMSSQFTIFVQGDIIIPYSKNIKNIAQQ